MRSPLSDPALSSSEQWFSFSEFSFQLSFGAVIRRARRGGSGLITGGNLGGYGASRWRPVVVGWSIVVLFGGVLVSRRLFSVDEILHECQWQWMQSWKGELSR